MVRLRPSTAPDRIGAAARAMGITTTTQRTETAALILRFSGLALSTQATRSKQILYRLAQHLRLGKQKQLTEQQSTIWGIDYGRNSQTTYSGARQFGR